MKKPEAVEGFGFSIYRRDQSVVISYLSERGAGAKRFAIRRR